MQRLVVDSSQIQPPIAVLTPEQQHYLSRVLRLKVGDRLIVLDGQGQSWLASLIPSDSSELPNATLLEPIVSQTELPISVTLVMALPKGNAFDEIVRQGTELGVACIAPVISTRTLLNPSAQKRDRWQRIAQESAEQSERQIVPTILEPVSFATHLANLSLEPALKPALEPPTEHYLAVTRYPAPHLLDRLFPPSRPLPLAPRLLIAIGPEGGWTEAEVAAAIAAGYRPISLGSRIFRAVTAPIAALALIAAAYERGTVER